MVYLDVVYTGEVREQQLQKCRLVHGQVCAGQGLQ